MNQKKIKDIKSNFKKFEPPIEEINNIKVFEDLAPSKEKKRKHSYKTIQTENKKISFLNVILVIIISFVALIVLLDTFKAQIVW